MARIVMVHGAFAGAWCWEPVLDGLREAGHEPETLDLPGSGADTTPVAEVTLDAYAARVCGQLAAGPPAVLAGHSMGGVVITQAAARCPERIISLIYVAAFLPGDGQSLLDLTAYPEAAGDQVQANLVVQGEPPVGSLSPAAAHDALLTCCDEHQSEWARARLRAQAVAPFGQPVALGDPPPEAFRALPRAYITCLRDRAIPPAMQRRMYTDGGCEPVIEIDTDHSPWISRTDELVAAIDESADRQERLHGMAGYP